MNEEEKALLQEAVELSRQNHKMLTKMHRSVRVGFWVHSVKWILIIASLAWSYLLIQPYFSRLQDTYNGIHDAQQSFSDLQGKFQVSGEEFENLLKSFNVGS